MYDAASQLSYLNARYFNGTQGQFISEDPLFLGNQSNQNLSDPQSLNAYSYSEDNPIVHSDPNGKQLEEVGGLLLIAAESGELQQLAAGASEDVTISEAERVALLNESTQAVDPAIDLSKNQKWIEIIGQPEKYGLDTAPVLNGPEGFRAPYLSSPFLQVSAPVATTIAVGTVAYRSSQGVSDPYDPNPPTVPHVPSQLSTNNASNGRAASTFSQNGGGGGISQGNLASLNSILNQLTTILTQLQNALSSQNTSNSSSKK